MVTTRFEIETTIEEEGFSILIKRTFEDFKILKSYVASKYVYIVCPPFPVKISNKEKYIKKLKRYFQRFINCILNQEVLKSDVLIYNFFTEED